MIKRVMTKIFCQIFSFCFNLSCVVEFKQCSVVMKE